MKQEMWDYSSTAFNTIPHQLFTKLRWTGYERPPVDLSVQFSCRQDTWWESMAASPTSSPSTQDHLKDVSWALNYTPSTHIIVWLYKAPTWPLSLVVTPSYWGSFPTTTSCLQRGGGDPDIVVPGKLPPIKHTVSKTKDHHSGSSGIHPTLSNCSL